MLSVSFTFAGHTWSLDGLSWSNPVIPAFGTIVHYTDNTTSTFDYCERPQVRTCTFAHSPAAVVPRH